MAEVKATFHDPAAKFVTVHRTREKVGLIPELKLFSSTPFERDQAGTKPQELKTAFKAGGRLLSVQLNG